MAQNSQPSGKRRGAGKPFQPGDPRINRGGRPPAVLTRAIFSKMTPERADALADVLLEKAEAGESWAFQALWERTEGKVPNRNENGQPGDFDLELDDAERQKLRDALKVVRGRRSA